MILCCGEALMDMIPVTCGDGRAAFRPCPGGAVFNTAVALGRLGARAGILTGLSTDFFGDQLRTALDESGVDRSLSPGSAHPTTLAFVQLSEGQARYAFHDENAAPRMIRAADLPALPGRVTTLFFGGISLCSEPCGSAYEALALRESARRVIMLDPNVRPGFAADAAAYRQRLDRLMACADILKLSEEDLEWLRPGAEPEAAIAELAGAGPSLVILTRGAKGATARTARGRTASRSAPAVTVADTVGAGDTFNAGVLAALDDAGALAKDRLAGLDRAILDDMLDLASRAAAVTVSRVGADPPTARELPARGTGAG